MQRTDEVVVKMINRSRQAAEEIAVGFANMTRQEIPNFPPKPPPKKKE